MCKKTLISDINSTYNHTILIGNVENSKQIFTMIIDNQWISLKNKSVWVNIKWYIKIKIFYIKLSNI